jgi:hypothetical protein
MGGARALIASLGASISLVAGAALSLLVVSFLFAYDGLSGGTDQPVSHAALLVEAHTPVTPTDRVPGSSRVKPLVLRTPAARERGPQDVVAGAAAPTRLRAGNGGVQTRQPAPAAGGVSDLGAAAPPTSNSGGSKPSAGDGVRDLGDGVSATVGETGEVAGGAAAPLGPPVSQAVQDVLNVVESLLKGATDGLAGTLDRALPRR